MCVDSSCNPDTLHDTTQWKNAKVTKLKSMISVHYTTFLGDITIMRTSCFDTDFVSQIKLTKHPLIHCFASDMTGFERNSIIFFSDN